MTQLGKTGQAQVGLKLHIHLPQVSKPSIHNSQ